MSILVTSASGSNGDGYGALLSFRLDGTFIGSFSDDPRIVDPRGMSVSPDRQHLYVNSGNDRILTLDTKGTVVRDTGAVPGLNAGGGHLGPDGRYYVGLRSARTIAAFPPISTAPRNPYCPPVWFRTLADSPSARMASFSLRPASVLTGKVKTTSSCLIRTVNCMLPASLRTTQ